MNSEQNPSFANAEAEIFSRAIEIDSSDERNAFLDVACGSSGELRSRLELLLKEFESPNAFFDAPDRALQSLSAVPQDNEKFGEFQIVREIGRGGMGIVYEAVQTSLNRRVALKVLAVGLKFSQQAIKRFQREAKSAAKLHHTNIVPIFTTGLRNEIPYYAMELVRGPSLDHVLKQLRDDARST